MLYTKFQAFELSGSAEDDFLNTFYVFLWFESRTLWPGPSLTLEPSLNILGKRKLGNATFQICANWS